MQFLDTNILVYSFDRDAPLKRARALQLIEAALQNPNSAVISSQVVQEFFNLATRKFAAEMPIAARERYLDVVLAPLCKHFPNPAHFQRALHLQARFQLQWYDSLIVASALGLGCTQLLSEDFQHLQRFDALTVVNPFAD